MASTRGTIDYETYMNMFREIHFNDLNDDCMIAIFHFIPLGELLRLEIICRRWKYCQEMIFERRKTKLVLLDVNRDSTKNSISEIKQCYISKGILVSKAFHHLNVDLTKPKNAQLLLNKFPKISKLEVVYDKLEDIVDQMLMLMDAWKENLTSLKLIIYSSINSASSWKRLFEQQINNLPVLKHLTVCDAGSRDNLGFRNRGAQAQVGPLATLSPALISRLEEFYFGLNDKINYCFNMFNLFQADSKLQTFALNTSGFYTEWNGDPYTPILDDVNEDFAKKITKLSIIWTGSTAFFTMLNAKFTSLTYLHLTSQLPFIELIPKIAKLKQLTELRLQFSTTVFPDVPVITRVASLPSIQALHLDCSYLRHHWNHHPSQVPHNELKHVSHLLPNLSSIKLHVALSGDFNCRIDNTHSKEACRSVFLASLTDYNRLRRVYFLNSNGYSGWEEAHSEEILAKYDVVYVLGGKQVLTVNQTMYI